MVHAFARPLVEVARGLLDLAFPPACLLCEAPLVDGPNQVLCPGCWRALPRIRGRACDRCGLPDPLGIWAPGCSRCRRKRFPYRSLVAGGEYHAGICDLVHQLKYGRFEAAARPLVRVLADRLRRQRTLERHGPELVVAIPSTWARRFERGLDPARIVARGLARRIELPFAPRALVRVQRARPQTGLSGPERRQNLKGVFQGRPRRVAGRIVLLVDDVRTTGSTLDEAARALKRAGARAVIAAVAAVVGGP